MAKQIRVLLTDDVDGTEATTTVNFALDGVNYEIDLSDANAAQLRDTFGPYVRAGRKVNRPARAARSARSGRSESDYDPKAVRAWAASNHIDLPKRGRIPGHVIEQYREAGY